MVAVAMTWRVAVRKPPMMIGDRERQLDPAEDLPLAHAHAAAGLDQVAIHLAQARVGADEDRAGSPAGSSRGRSGGTSGRAPGS